MDNYSENKILSVLDLFAIFFFVVYLFILLLWQQKLEWKRIYAIPAECWAMYLFLNY